MRGWLFGASIVGMVGMHSSIRSGSSRISTVHMAVSMSVSRKRISIDLFITGLLSFLYYVLWVFLLIYFSQINYLWNIR